MVAHCVRESPLECCGILGGTRLAVSSLHPLRNDLASETRYHADPQDLIEATSPCAAQGAEILAIYHSHPRWQAVPSQTDLEENHYGPVRRSSFRCWTSRPRCAIWRARRRFVPRSSPGGSSSPLPGHRCLRLQAQPDSVD